MEPRSDPTDTIWPFPFTPQDWAQTPLAVQAYVRALRDEVQQLHDGVIPVKRDNRRSIAYSEELTSSTISVTLQSTDRRSCPCSLRLNTRGLPGDRHRSNKMPSIEPSWPLRGPLSLVTPSPPAVRTHVACADQLP
jgi:hypothetical protein